MNHNLVCKEDQQEYSVCRFYNDVVKNIVYGKQCKSILTYLKKVSGLQLQPIKKRKENKVWMDSVCKELCMQGELFAVV